MSLVTVEDTVTGSYTSTMSWMFEFTLKERKKIAEFNEMLILKPVRLVLKKGRLRWFVHAECK